MLGMAYNLITRYEVEAREPLDLMAAHALSRLALATEGLIHDLGATKRADFVLDGTEYSPVLPHLPGIMPEFHAERVKPDSWFVAAYLPTMQRRSKSKASMNYASYSVNAYPDPHHVADLGRYFWGRVDGGRASRVQIAPKQLTPRAIIEALVPAVETLQTHAAGMEEYWKVR